ncbi:MAG: hypothetical protein ASARMPRED_007193 [Alectoria sarmentosa]|nr:MAG: hypothetical protein ASARMPRED_007193 [Alectoria sarmentosa]
MQLTHMLIGAFAILANAQRYHPHGFHNQQKRAAQVAGSNTDSDTGSNTGSDTGSGTIGNDTSSGAASSAPQSSVSSTGSTTSGSSSSSSSNNAVGSTASFTQYGPCNDPSKTSCAWYSSTGFNAAISQAVYGGYPGSGPSAACGICWKLTPDYAGANEIFVKVNNLCPDDQNPLCAQPAGEFFLITQTPQLASISGFADFGFFPDVDINFDLCEDSGAATALFGSSNVQQVNGTAVIVDCSQNWSGGANVCLPGVESC